MATVLKGAVLLALAGFVAWAVTGAGNGLLAAGSATLHALWLLPALVALQLLQLLVSAGAWGRLLTRRISLPTLFRLRVVREGIDSLLPVAQVGGEVVGARLLSRYGIPMPEAAASVVVDVTVEFGTQLGFLLVGMAALARVAPDYAWLGWTGAALVIAGLCAGLLVAQRLGGLRLLEAFARQVAQRFPSLGTLDGLDGAVSTIYRRHGRLGTAAALHLFAWLVGSLESWAVLWTLGHPVSPTAALAVEALGMAARSAGFAVPGAVVVQETGFVLAAAAVGLPDSAGLSLSLVKRAKEVVVALPGMALWWRERQRSARYVPS